jgi:hypothetical protein
MSTTREFMMNEKYAYKCLDWYWPGSEQAKVVQDGGKFYLEITEPYNPEQIEEGAYYWVKFNGMPSSPDHAWEIAQWCDRDWSRCGSDVPGGYVVELGPKVEPPSVM